MNQYIKIKGARENNLKNISLQIPKNKLVVFSGLSGSGKSTLALDTLQRECQRQYMESMGMVTDLMRKPKVDEIIGLSPSISVDQHNSNRNPRSTVGTITDVSSYLRVLYAKLGERYCPRCRERLPMTFDTGLEEEFYQHGAEVEQETQIELDDQVELDAQLVCCHCNAKIPELTASHFSFNKPQGACSTCKGIGIVSVPNVDLVINKKLSIFDGAVDGWDKAYINRYSESLENAGKHYGFALNASAPIQEYSDVARDLLLYGALSPRFQRHFPDVEPPKTVPLGRFEGVITNLMRRYSEAKTGSNTKTKIEKVLIQNTCPDCNGSRFKQEVLQVKLGGLNIEQISEKSLYDVQNWIKSLAELENPNVKAIVQPIIEDLEVKLKRLFDVGVGYLSLNRSAPTLSAGEAQRFRLASLLGSGLTGVLYVLDEPTAGLHASDTVKLIGVLKKLRDLGNTVVVIEHDTEMMRAADYIIDFGPEAGKNGGQIVATGTPQEIAENKNSITGRYIYESPEKLLEQNLKPLNNKTVVNIVGARQNNLKNLDVKIPLGGLVAVTGVSGSGKSSLVFETLNNIVMQHFYDTKEIPGQHDKVTGLENIDDVITINQAAIGRTPRSNAATYTEVFNYIRDLYGSSKESKKAGFTAKHFSFNTTGGRCEKCQGAGELTIPMHFLPDVQVKCPVCQGKRFQKKILNIEYNGANIADVLNMSIEEALDIFIDEKPIAERLLVLKEVGLGYLGLGQPATTLSGGEAQRIKLAKELSKKGRGHSLYLLDEPTTGLHPHDVRKLVALFKRLINQGNSVIVVEHNIDVIKQADWIIDLGPEGGQAGGYVIAQGRIMDIIRNKHSKTGKCLKEAVAFE